MYKKFESRKPFAYGVTSFDKLIPTEEMPNSFVFYQEMEMAALHYAGIPMSECYAAIKNIAKKRAEKVLQYKQQFILGFQNAIVRDEGKAEMEARELAERLWQIIEDSASYSFNASHSYCVALDSLYGAWLKAHFPYEFYETLMELCEEKGNKDKLMQAKEEASSFFGIKFPPLRFGQDNRKITADKQAGVITNSIASIKGFSKTDADVLYECGQQGFEEFIDVLLWLDSHKLKAAKIQSLIKIGYFQPFGNTRTLLELLELCGLLKYGQAKYIAKEKVPAYAIPLFEQVEEKSKTGKSNRFNVAKTALSLLHALETYFVEKPLTEFPFRELIKMSIDVLGYSNIATGQKQDRRRLYIEEIYPLGDKALPWGYSVNGRSLGSGKLTRFTIKAALYNKIPIHKENLIYVRDYYTTASGYLTVTEYAKENS